MIWALSGTRFSRALPGLAAVLAAAVVVGATTAFTPGSLAASAAVIGALALGAGAIRHAGASAVTPSTSPIGGCPAAHAAHPLASPIRQCDPDAPGRVRSRAPGDGNRLG